MIKFDFDTYTSSLIDKKIYDELYSKKEDIFNKFNYSNMIGWTKEISKDLIDDIKSTANYVKEEFDSLVVIGIGGSFLGSYAFDMMFKKYFNDNSFEVIYAGETLSSKYLDELINYLENKNFCLNVISKSGTTMETSITYKLITDLLKRKYMEDELRKHIIITTSKDSGLLREEVNKKHYKSFEIPNDIGGRYSFITPAHLFPLALNYNIDDIIKGYYKGKVLKEEAFKYAVIRNTLFRQKKYIENFCVYEKNMFYFTEWLKQLFGESEGKNGLGIFPTSTVHTRDLHSLGQFIQEGNKIVFETFIKINKTNNYINYENRDLHDINNLVLDSVIKAHFSGDVACIEIELNELDEKTISMLIYFFMLSAAFSALLFEVEPFDQPGVEVYKNFVRESLK